MRGVILRRLSPCMYRAYLVTSDPFAWTHACGIPGTGLLPIRPKKAALLLGAPMTTLAAVMPATLKNLRRLAYLELRHAGTPPPTRNWSGSTEGELKAIDIDNLHQNIAFGEWIFSRFRHPTT